MKTKKLGKMATRVRLAKDVLAQIKSGLIKPRMGDYLLGSFVGTCMNEATLQAEAKRKPCMACAQGSLLVAWLRRFDGIDSWDLSDEIHNLGGRAEYSTLTKIFPGTMLRDMESIFEGHSLCNAVYPDEMPTHTQRLKDLMKNLVKTGGQSIYPVGEPNKRTAK